VNTAESRLQSIQSLICSTLVVALRCVSVRLGNVLGSNGSVVPVLQQQLENNRPLTITHPEIKRFFMTTREAVALVLEASTVGEHGDILVLEMGKQISIVELARTLIQLSGKTENQVSIHFTGLRPGKKLYEEMSSSAEEIIVHGSAQDQANSRKACRMAPAFPAPGGIARFFDA
jgi:FlaA1/EpsC-like NDP-sugar epimerase